MAGCGEDTGAPTATTSPTTPAALPTAVSGLPVQRWTVGSASLRVEIAATEGARVAGLRGRTGVPPGTGMVFVFDPAQRVRFTMAGVTYPLVAVFVSGGKVVSVSQMAPCAGTVEACPHYGPDVPVENVVEAAPGSLPAVAVGDRAGVTPG